MSVYVTSTARFLPGPPIDNDHIETHLGFINGKPSRLKSRILKSNGIRTRHYAINSQHETVHSNADMAIAAANACISRSGVSPSRIGMLSCATTQGDVALPGFGSMVQAGLPLSGIELHTTHGICSSSAMSFKAAVNNIKAGDQQAALVVASELASRLFKHTRYEAAGGARAVTFDAEFLRWMLSDGAGALLLQDQPSQSCLRVDWIRSFSHAESYPVCMGLGSPTNRNDTRTWQDYPTFAEAEAAGSMLLRQDVRLLSNMIKLGVDGALRLIEEGILDTSKIDHLLCHYSSHHFKGQIFDMLEMAGASVPETKWYSNLYTRGNTGCASIYIMLDEFLEVTELKDGETVLLMIPESGRFNTAYIHLTAVQQSNEQHS
jgi:3-oxoacyl-[acyl-carrier-protein] synthase-3